MPANAGTDLPGTAAARAALVSGRAVVVPSPSPLPYGVAATSPAVVNLAKGRPAGQEVGFWVHDDTVWRGLVPVFDLDPAGVATALRLLRRELVTLLVPLRPGSAVPGWLDPSVRAGHALFFGGRWAPLAGLLAGFPLLYLSSANRTGQPPVATAAVAAATFGPDVPVVDGDALRDRTGPYGSTTMVRIGSGGELTVARRGVQDAAHGPDPDTYLRWLRTTGT